MKACALGPPRQSAAPLSRAQEALRAHLKLPNQEALITWTYSDLAWARIASLAPIAFQAARDGDRVAQGILETAADSLANCVLTVVRKLRPSGRFPVVLAGSIAQDAQMSTLVSARVKKEFPGAEIGKTKVDAAVGAALLYFTGALRPKATVSAL